MPTPFVTTLTSDTPEDPKGRGTGPTWGRGVTVSALVRSHSESAGYLSPTHNRDTDRLHRKTTVYTRLCRVGALSHQSSGEPSPREKGLNSRCTLERGVTRVSPRPSDTHKRVTKRHCSRSEHPRTGRQLPPTPTPLRSTSLPPVRPEAV